MYKISLIVIDDIKKWHLNPRVIIAFMLGCALYAIPFMRLRTLAVALGETYNIFEPFIICGSTPYFYTFSLLGLLLLLSDAPFVSDRTPYIFIRVSKTKWVSAQIIYIFLTSFFYYFSLFAFSLVFGYIASNLQNEWSHVVQFLIDNPSEYFASKFGISFYYPAFVHAVRPFMAWLLTWSLNSLYGIVLCLCLFVLNIWGKGVLGWISAMIIHVSSYVVIMSGIFFYSPKLSFLVYAMPAFGYIGNPYPSIGESYIYIGILVLLLYIAAYFGIKNRSLYGAKQ